MHARVVLWVGKGVLFREVSSVQECPQFRSVLIERERFHYNRDVCIHTLAHSHSTYIQQIVGLALIGVGIWLLVQETDYSFVTDSLYASPAALLIVAGVITVVISIVGVIGALGMWYCVLIVVGCVCVCACVKY